MIPKNFSQAQTKLQSKQSIFPTHEDTVLVPDQKYNFDRSTCSECNYKFGWAKNKIVYTQYVILLKDEDEWKTICSKCLNIFDDKKIKLIYTYDEFQKRILNEKN